MPLVYVVFKYGYAWGYSFMNCVDVVEDLFVILWITQAALLTIQFSADGARPEEAGQG